MKYCPTCLRSEASAADCPNGDFPGMACPELVEADPTKTVSLNCGPCDMSRVVPISKLMSGAAQRQLPTCKRDDCACVLVPSDLGLQQAKVAKPKPPKA